MLMCFPFPEAENSKIVNAKCLSSMSVVDPEGREKKVVAPVSDMLKVFAV